MVEVKQSKIDGRDFRYFLADELDLPRFRIDKMEDLFGEFEEKLSENKYNLTKELVEKFIQLGKEHRNFAKVFMLYFNKKHYDGFLTFLKTKKGIAQSSINKYMIYFSKYQIVLLDKPKINLETINKFLKNYNTLPARSFLKNYLDYRKRSKLKAYIVKKTGRKYSEPIEKKSISISEFKLMEKYLLGRISKSKNNNILKRNLLLINMLFVTGLRASELVNLKISDIDFKNKEVYFKGKGNKPDFKAITEKVSDMLSGYISRNDLKDEDRLFRFSSTWLYNITKGIYKKVFGSDIKNRKGNPHSFRHGHAVHLRKKGSSIEEIQSDLGHSDIRTTQIYSKIDNKKVRDKSRKAFEEE